MISIGPVDQVTPEDVLREVDVEPTPFVLAVVSYAVALLIVPGWVIWPTSVAVTGSLVGGTITTLLIAMAGGCLWAYRDQHSWNSTAGRERRATDLARRAVDREAFRLGLTLRTSDSFVDGTRATIGHTAAWRYHEQVCQVAREAVAQAEARRRAAHEAQVAQEADRRATFEGRIAQLRAQVADTTHLDHSTGGRP